MKILVTGRNGQLARCLAERAGAGHRLTFAGRPGLDLTSEPSIRRAIATARPDLVISAAAYTAVDAAESDRDTAMTVNGKAPGIIAAAAAEVGAPVIHLSTDYVFDGRLDRPAREDDAVGPLNVYGQTKLAGERAVAQSGARFAIVRTSWLYSPFGSNFVKTMLRLATEREEIAVVDDQRGRPTSAFDLAIALLSVADRWASEPDHGINEVYHFAGSDTLTWAQFANAIFEESSVRGGPSAEVRPVPASSYETAAERPLNSALDSSRFAATFARKAPPWRQSLGEVVSRLINEGRSRSRR